MDSLNLKYDGKSFNAFTPASLRAAGVPEEVIAAAMLDERNAAISAECRRRIYAVAGAEAQMNINGEANLITIKIASQRTEEEVKFLADFKLSLDWIKSMRAAYDVLSADADADHLADANWPECPPAVIALAGRY